MHNHLCAKSEITYYDTGEVKLVKEFVDGTQDGVNKMYTKSGDLILYQNIKNGQPHGQGWLFGRGGGVIENLLEFGKLCEAIHFDSKARIRNITEYRNKRRDNLSIYLDEQERMFFMMMTKDDKLVSPAYVYDQDLRDEYIIEFDTDSMTTYRTKSNGEREKGFCHYVTDLLNKNGMEIDACYNKTVDF